MNQKRFIYSVMSWNVHGLGRQDKCDAIHGTVSISHPHIAYLQETKLNEINAYKCKSFPPPPFRLRFRPRGWI